MFNKAFDIYSWRARILPLFIVVMPLVVAAAIWLPQPTLLTRLGSFTLVPLGLGMLFSQVGRDLGFKKQSQLWDKWGGCPTIQRLRHCNSEINPKLRDRHHRKLKSLVPDLFIPSKEEEEKDPVVADQIYDVGMRYLMSQTRDRKQYPLIFKENVSYGFRRNLWALKPFGIAFNILCIGSASAYIWHGWKVSHSISPEHLVVGLLSLGFVIFWLVWITHSWVRIPSEAYAIQLLEACEQLKNSNVVK